MADAAAALRLRVARPDDAAALLAIYGPLVRDTAISFELEPPTVDAFAARIEQRLATHPWLVAAGPSGAPLGYAYATRFRDRPAYDWTAESSVYVAADARGRGVGRALGAALLTLLERQGFAAVVAGITLPNEPSRALHRRLGYRSVGSLGRVGVKFGAFHAVEFWQRDCGGAEPPTAAPTPFAALMAGGEFDPAGSMRGARAGPGTSKRPPSGRHGPQGRP